MASQWYSLVSQKLFLASTLLDTPSPAPIAASPSPVQKLQQEAATQGCIELLLRARLLLLVMVARLYQKRSETPSSVAELANLIGDQAAEIQMLLALERNSGSWWKHLDQLEAAQNNPPAMRKTVSAENIIAVSAEAGPERSAQSLRETLKAMKQFADNLEEQHGEW
jgi:hypothetical protein